MTTLHSVINDQPLIDRYHHSDLRRIPESQPWWHGSCYPPIDLTPSHYDLKHPFLVRNAARFQTIEFQFCRLVARSRL
jgi:hypothetical protein